MFTEIFRLLGTIAIDNRDATRAIDDTTNQASGASGKITAAFKKIGAAVVAYLAVDKIIDFGLACVQAAADAQAASSQFSQVFGEMEGQAAKNLSDIANTSGIVESRLKSSYTKIAAFAKTSGMETADALALADRSMIAIADSAAFYDRSLEETTESLQSFLKGNFENDAALGLSATETTRNAAANKLYGKTFIELSESQKQLTLLQMVEDANELSGAMGQAARESNTWTNQTGNLKQAWTDFQAVVGSYFLEPVVDGVKFLSDAVVSLTEKFPGVVDWIKENNVALFALTGGLGVAYAQTGAVGLAFSTLYTKSETFRNAIESLKQGAVNAFNGMKEAAINTKDRLVGAWDVITDRCTIVAAAIRGNVLGAFEDLREKGNALKNGLQELKEKFDPVIDLISGAFSKASSGASDGFDRLTNKAADFAKNALSKVNEGITEARELFDKFSEKAAELWKNLDPVVTLIRDNLLNSLKSMKEPLQSIKDSFEQVYTTFREELYPVLKEQLLPLWEQQKDMWITLAQIIGGALAIALGLLTGLLNGIAQAVSGVMKTMSGWIQIAANVFDLIVGIFTGNKELCVQALEGILEGAKKVFGGLWESTKGFLLGFVDGVVGFFKGLYDTLVGHSIVPDTITGIVNCFAGLWGKVKGIVSGFKDNIVKTFNDIKSKIVNAVDSAVTSAKNKFNTMKNNVSTAMNAAKNAVSTAFSTIRTKVSDGASSAFNTVKSKFDSIKKKISDIMSSAKTTVSEAISKIKGFFDFDWSLPKLKMPKFSLSGKFSIDPPSVPKIGVEWYSKAMGNAMILDKPTIFGYSAEAGKLLGGGEAGSEVVAGSQTLMNMIQAAVAEQNAGLTYYLQKLIQILANYFPQILDAMDRPLCFDPESAADALVLPLDARFGKLKERKDRGR